MGKVLISVLTLAVVYLFLQHNFAKPLSTSQVESPKSVLSVKIQDQEVHSSDGAMNLIMKVQKNVDNTNTFSFFASDIADKNKRFLFSKSLSPSGRMEIPQNAWSPDNKLIFLHEDKDGIPDWYVFKADSGTFGKDENFLDIQGVFKTRKSDYYITDVTGWDGPSLLHVKTAYDKSTKGSSFWFDTTSKTFIQLANR